MLERSCPRCEAAMPARFAYCGACGARLATTEGPGERRQVTCVFADISGFTSLAERLDPEQLHGVMRTAWDAIAEEIRRADGMIEKYIGDAIVAVFGAPVAHDDDPERALAAAIAVRDALERVNEDIERRASRRLGLRIGVNTGVAVAGAIGDRESEYGVLGDAVNVAARLQQAAETGEILVGDATYRRAAHAFQFEPHPPVVAKGKSAPIVTWRLSGTATEEARRAIPLVGRTDELARLLEAVADAEAGRGRAVTVLAETGMGASRLVAELIGDPRVRGVRLAYATCTPYERHRAYAPVRDLLRALLAVPRADPSGQGRRVLAQLLPGLEPEVRELVLETMGEVVAGNEVVAGTRRRLLERGVRDVVLRIAETQPVLLVVEDAHDIDHASLGLLRSLVANLAGSRVALVITARPGFAAPWATRPHHVLVRVEPLGRDDAEQLLRAHLPTAPLPDDLVRRTLARAGGSPAFVAEAARAFVESGLVVERDGRTVLDLAREPELPASLGALVQERVARLGAAERRVVQAAAVLGRTFDRELLVGMLGSDAEAAAAVAGLLAAGIVEPADEATLRFVHASGREAIYRAPLARTRGELHGRVALAIERYQPDVAAQEPELLAHHLGLSPYTLRAIEYALRAGERAISLDDLPDAVLHFRAAAELADRLSESGEERARALERLGDALRLAGERRAAIDAYEHAAETATDPERAVLARVHAGRLLAEAGDLERSALHLAAAERDASSPELRAELAIAKAHLALRADRPVDALTLAEEAIRLAVAAGDGRAELGATLAVARAAADAGRIDRRRTALERGAELAFAVGAIARGAELLLELGALLGDVGRHEERERAAREAADRFAQLGDDAGRARSMRAIAEAHLGFRDLGNAEAALEEALAISRSLDDPVEAQPAAIQHLFGEVALARGDLPAAETRLERALELAAALPARAHVRTRALAALARIALESGDIRRARSRIETALAQQRVDGCARCFAAAAPIAADVALAEGDVAGAEARCAAGLEEATRSQLANDVALVRLALARVASARHDDALARELVEGVLAGLVERGPAHVLGAALLQYADVLAAAGRVDDAREALRRSEAVFAQTGAPRRAAVAAERLAELATVGRESAG